MGAAGSGRTHFLPTTAPSSFPAANSRSSCNFLHVIVITANCEAAD